MEEIDLEFLDSILLELPSDKGLIKTSYESEESKLELESALHLLESHGYVYLRKTIEGIYGHGLTDLGLVFIKKGGFKNEAKKKEIEDSQRIEEKNFRNKTYRISIWEIVITATISIGSIGYGLINDVRVRNMTGEILMLNKSIDSLNLEIDSLKSIKMIDNGHINENK